MDGSVVDYILYSKTDHASDNVNYAQCVHDFWGEIYPFPALFSLNFYPLEVVPRYRHPQLQLGFANIWSHVKQMSVIFTHLKLWVAVARHNFKCVKYHNSIQI